MTATDGILSAAQGYIARGWPAFVLSSSKTPVANCDRCRAEHDTPELMESCTCLTCHGFYAATLDPGRITEMIRLYPRGLLAIRAGAASGTVVVDVDAPQGIPTMRRLITDGLLPRTVVQRTGSGGYHLVYRHPGVRIMSGAGKGGRGVDIKADGGYIVVAPSAHPRTHEPYQWLVPFSGDLTPLPQHWADRLREPPQPARPGVAAPLATGGGSRYAAKALRAELESVLTAAPGTRNETLHRAAFSLGQLMAAGALDGPRVEELLGQAGEHIGLPPGEVARTIASGITAGRSHPRERAT